MSALISAEELKKILTQPDVKILDASYGLPPSEQSIQGAQEFDIDDVADPDAPLAHTVPSEDIFSKKVSALGISNNDLVVIYDRSGLAMSAARGWWMFRLFGHEKVKILNGGLPAWIKAGGILEKTIQSPAKTTAYKSAIKPKLLKLREQIQENITTGNFTLLDARDAGRFRGDAPDPRPNVAAGHIPGSLSTPYAGLLNPDGTLKPKDQLEMTFRAANVNLQKKLACSCGSGVTACVVALALHELGCTDAAVYDGSWTEWGSDPSLPKAKGD